MPALARDGIHLAYEEAGSGDPAVLIPGWCCTTWCLHRQADHLARTRRAITVDLRGHGGSDAPDGAYSIESLADDVSWMLDRLDVAQVDLLGFSMGAHVALRLATEQPERVRSLVLLDASPFSSPADKKAALGDLLKALRDDTASARRALWSGFFTEPNASNTVHAETLRLASQTPDHVAISMMQNFIDWDGPAAARPWSRPVLALVSEQGEWPRRVDDLVTLFDRIVIGKTVGAGHMHLLEVPEQVNLMIDAFYRTYLD